MQSLIRFGTIFALSLLLMQCISDAPRTNILDPALSNNRLIKVEGNVTRLNATTAIPDAKVFIIGSDARTLSTQNGAYVLQAELPEGEYQIACTAEGFSADTVVASLKVGSPTKVNFQLNALPEISSVSLLTRHIGSFIPPNQLFADLTVTANDPDGFSDIQSVLVEIPAFGFRDTLQFLPLQQQFFIRLTPALVGINSLERLEGIPLTIIARDSRNAEQHSDGHVISRIIRETPKTTAPNGTATQPIQFLWQSFLRPYPFTYRIEIYPNVNIALPPVAIINEIPSTETTAVLTDILSDGEYYWVLYVVDQLGNYSRSVQTPLILN